MTTPLVSVIIPAFNRAHSIRISIDSVLQQTYQPLEVVVVDDGSTDETADVLAEYGNQIISIRQENSGPSSARNKGVAHAKGDIIAFLDSDDTWEPQKLERQIRLMVQGGSKVPCCVCNARNMIDGIPASTSFEIAGVDCNLEEGYWLNPTDLIATRFILFNQVVAIRRSTFEQIGGFKPCLRILEDHDLAFRLSLFGPWAFIADTLVTKFDQADGLGVQARKDPTLHARAWAGVLNGFLSERIEDREPVVRFIRRAMNDVAIELRAIQLSHSRGLVMRQVSRLLMRWLRCKIAIRRRLPSWPRVDAVATLSPAQLTLIEAKISPN